MFYKIRHGSNWLGYKLPGNHFCDSNGSALANFHNLEIYRNIKLHCKIIEDGKDFFLHESAGHLICEKNLALKIINEFPEEVQIHDILVPSSDLIYQILEVKNFTPCIDINESELKLNDDGSIESIYYIMIDENKCHGLNILRVKESPGYIICSERFKCFIETNCSPSINFIPLELPDHIKNFRKNNPGVKQFS